MAHQPSARRAAIPAERRHHRRGADAQRALRAARGKGVVARGGPVLGKIEEVLPGDADARRHLPVRRQDAALRGHPRERGLRLERRQARTRRSPSMPAASSRSRPISPIRCGRCSPTRSAGRRCPSRSPTGCALQEREVGPAAARRPPGRDLPARRALLHGRLSLRGPARAPDARHAADAPAGARRRAAARLRRHRLFARRLGARRSRRAVRSGRAVACRAVRRGHAGRRSRGLAGRESTC